MSDIKTKVDCYNELTRLLTDVEDGIGIITDDIIKYLCDYFNTQTLKEFIEHIKSERQ